MTLAPISDNLTRWAQTLAPARQLAEIVAGTDFVPGALRGNPDACTAAIMYGDEIGVGPMQALASIHMVDGRPQPSAELVRALILRAGHTFAVHTANGDVCRVSGLRRGAPESERVTVEWTMAMARSAGLVRRQAWQQYPRAMLLARATGELGRILFPDVVKGLSYVAEDQADEIETWAQQVAGADPQPPALEAPATTRVTRKRAPRKATGQPVEDVPLPEAVPDAAPEPDAPLVDPWAEPLDRESKGSGLAGDPEPAPVESSPTPRPVSDQLRKSLMAQTSRVGIDPTLDRATRLALWSVLLGREVTTTGDLARPDALRLLGLLSELETGEAEWTLDASTGAVTVRRLTEGTNG